MLHAFPFHPIHFLSHSWCCYIQFPSCVTMWADLCVFIWMTASLMHFVCFCHTFRKTQRALFLIPEHADTFPSSETRDPLCAHLVLHLSVISFHSMYFGTSSLFPSTGLVSSVYKRCRPGFAGCKCWVPKWSSHCLQSHHRQK